MTSKTISNVTTKLALLRDGEYKNFTPGDQLMDGDVLVNNTSGPLRVSSLLNPSNENFQQVLLAPGGSTKVIDAGERDVDLVALDGAVLQTTDEIEADSADVVLHDETSMMGLLGGVGAGAGLLALAGLAALAAAGSDGGGGDTVIVPQEEPTPAPTDIPLPTPVPTVEPTMAPSPEPEPEPSVSTNLTLLGVNQTDNTATVAGQELPADSGNPDNTTVLASADQQAASVTLGGVPSETGDGNIILLAGNQSDMNLTVADMQLPGAGDPANNDFAVIVNQDDFTLTLEGGALADGGMSPASAISTTPIDELSAQLAQLGTLPSL